MDAKMIYHTYRECVANAGMMFTHYEKYNNCISLDSLDNDMQEVFSKIALDYTKFMMLVNNRLELDSPADLPASLLGICHSHTCLELRSVYLNRIAEFMDKNESLILKIFATVDFKCINKDMDRLKSSLQKASQLINRMEMLLKSSQQIYQQKLRISA